MNSYNTWYFEVRELAFWSLALGKIVCGDLHGVSPFGYAD